MSVIVLMSTYNGENYIKEQIESLINQELRPNKILIRDDGSSDKTIEILSEFKKKYPFIEFYCGENKKTAKSFWDLINKAGDFDYYSLCDQDDVWFINKLKTAVETLDKENNQIPLLYCSRFTMTDENLNVLHSDISKLYSYCDFAHSLLYQTAPGCTFVFNKAARNKIIQYDIEKNYCIIHDSIIHKVVTMFGKLILDTNSYMYYRQHNNNQIGFPKTKIHQFVLRVINFISKKNKNYRSQIAKALLDVYGKDVSEEKKQLLRTVALYNEKNEYRKQLLINPCFKVEGINYIFFRILVLFNYI